MSAFNVPPALQSPGGGPAVTIKSHYTDETVKVRRAVGAANIRSLGGAGAYIRGIVRKSISKRKDGPSPPGKPPRSGTGRLHASIAFAVDKAAGNVVIGPARAVIAEIGKTHEFSGVEGPKRERSTRHKTLFQIRIGGLGPIRMRDQRARRTAGPLTERDARRARQQAIRAVAIARLHTAAQVARAEEIVAQLQLPPSVTGLPASATRRYPARPFMRPALERSRARLPAFWLNSVRGD